MDMHEKDMNEMLKYLTEVEDMMKGQDLTQIQQMMDVTKDGMTQHFQAYDKMKDQITAMNIQADEAIKSLNFYEKDPVTKIGGKYELTRIEEAPGAEKAEGSSKPSLEGSKKGIVDKLLNMNQSMRDFSIDLESKLDQAYKSGAGKKYGYSAIATTAKSNIKSSSESDEPKSRKEDRMLNKVANQAQSFLETNNSTSIIGGGASFSNAGKKAYKASMPTGIAAGTLKRKASLRRSSSNTNDDLESLKKWDY